MTIAPFDLLLLLGTLQGFILATLLWINGKGNRLSNRLLATLIGLLAMMSLAVGVPIPNPWVGLLLDLLPLFVIMPLGPLMYFYSKSMLDPAFQLGRQERRHFYPAVLDLGSPLIIWTFFIGKFLGLVDGKSGPAWGHAMQEYNTYADIPRWISLTVYLVLTGRLLNSYRATRTKQPDEKNLRLLRQFFTAFLIFQVIWFIHLVPYIIPATRGPLLDRVGWYPIYVPIAVLIYWLGLKGYLHARSTTPVVQPPKPAGAELPEAIVKPVVDALLNAMSAKQLFLDPELTVEKLGQHTQLSPKLISAVLNQHVRKNFNGFVNEYRVDAVKQRLTDPAYGNLTLTGIAFDCGFNSQATFQRTFKQLTGVSPGEYQAQQKKNTAQIRI
ncbi:helix-turn-helix domain-containing protein [Spirosoma oryzicola]|uniref:helix-turn-helix domain-containing protein n=1 Tax=Spirosoma oryzicola TaxID=2898794 RepID=UPI001E612C74|nr:helix-turn-helix transcriptional regulator [Spirosoma oryzicola]UHG90769.1 helix-turn-helix transcriptional regulator [Spirosoma oryzicola]